MLSKNDIKLISEVVVKSINALVPGIIHKLIPDIIKKQLQPLRKDISKIKRDLKMIANYFDREYLDHDKRITKIEKHLGFPSQV